MRRARWFDSTRRSMNQKRRVAGFWEARGSGLCTRDEPESAQVPTASAFSMTRSRSARAVNKAMRTAGRQAGRQAGLPLMTGSEATAVHLPNAPRIHTKQHTRALSTPLSAARQRAGHLLIAARAVICAQRERPRAACRRRQQRFI